MRYSIAVALSLATPLLSLAGTPEVAYDNFGAGNAHKVDSGAAVLGPSFPTQQILAVRFVPGHDLQLTEVDVAGEDIAGPDAFRLSLAADAGGQPGATVAALGVFTLPLGKGDLSGAYEAVTVPGSAGAVVTGGVPYWVVMSAGANGADGIWDSALAALPGDVYEANYLDGTGWRVIEHVPTASLRVIGTVVPEPGGVGMVLGCVLGVVGRRRGRRG